MLWLARLAVLLAAVTTLWFNGSYSYSKGDTDLHKLGLVALALTIDLCKCSFLPAAADAWHHAHRLRATVFVLLWLPALSFSTFCGYALLTTNRTSTAAAIDAKASGQDRAQQRFDQAKADLATAKASPLWMTTAACTNPKDKPQRTYCDNISTLQEAFDTASNQLAPSPTLKADPELTALSRILTASPDTLRFVVSLVPALLIELIASLGSYAVAPRYAVRDSRKPVGRRLRWSSLQRQPKPENASGDVLEASGAVLPKQPPVDTAPKLVWPSS